MASAALQSALRDRWRSQKPDNTWAARRSGAIPEKEASAWDTFDAREPVVERAASEVCEETTSQKKKDKKAKRKELWIEPKALNAAGFAIGKRHIVGGSGDFVRSAHGERRDRKRAAKREEREAKRAAKRQRLEEATVSGDCDANADGTAAPAAASASAGAPATVAPSTCSVVVVVDPFHGRLVAASAPASARPSCKVGSKRRKRRKRLEEARQAASGGDEAGAPTATTTATTAAAVAADATANEPKAATANEPVGARAADRSSCREAAAAKRVASGEEGCWDSSRNSSREHRPPRKQFPYGNYDAYYGYRYVGGGGSGGGGGGSGSSGGGSSGGGGSAHHGALDPRLAAIDPSWLQDKDCLDIGCNAGQFTASLASRFGVRSMLGLDIDATLVTRAQRLLRHVAPLVGPPQNSTAAASPPMPPVAAAPPAAAASSQLAAAATDAIAPAAAAPLPDPAAGHLSNDDFRRLLRLPPRSVPDTAPDVAVPLPAATPAPAAAVTVEATVSSVSSKAPAAAAAATSFPISFPALYGGRPASAVADASDETDETVASAVAGASAASAPPPPSSTASASAPPSLSAFPHNTRFVHMNFVEEPPAAGQLGVGPAALAARFDVVCCFSTSKWIHLNWGDEGLQRLFVRAHACLRPGGLFLLEPQPWSSYRKRAGLTPLIKRNYETIRLRPEGFCAYLTSEAVGFASARPIEVAYGEEVGDNFRRRPLIVCEKRGEGVGRRSEG